MVNLLLFVVYLPKFTKYNFLVNLTNKLKSLDLNGFIRLY